VFWIAHATFSERISPSFASILGASGKLMTEQLTPAVQDYLKAIHSLGGADGAVPPVDIAERLRVRAPSVTGMLKRLAEAGWITYVSGQGAKLTETGLAEARRVVRRHRLVELFLTRVLGLDWSEVDAEADALEHAISPRLEQALASYLQEPHEDPHGHLIPTREGHLKQRQLQSLDHFRAGQRVVIREVQDDNPERLRRWQSQGLTPGATVRIRSYQPLDDLFELEVGEAVIPLGSEALAGLRGELIP
jgi:DtxR family transcriptional regulator, Mn-dependent transcriptional regulator